MKTTIINMDDRITNRTERQGFLPVFTKLFGIILVIFFLTACAKNEQDVLLPDDDVESLDLSGVAADLETGNITGTTTEMEYSLNSTDGVNGTWTAANSGSTAVTFVEGQVYIRQANKWTNVRLVGTVGPGIDLDEVAIDIAGGYITGTTFEIEYSLNSTDGTDGTWTTASNANTAVTFVAGKVYVRETAQPSNVRLVATIDPAAPAPTLVGDDDANSIIGLTEIHEYSIDGGAWTSVSSVPSFAGTVAVQVRVKATASVLASEIQTIEFTENAGVTVIFEENFNDITSLAGLGWGDRTTGAEGTIPVVSTTEGFDGTHGLYFPGQGGIISKIFDSGGVENIIFECKARVSAPGVSFTIGLYNSGTALLRTSLFSGNYAYYADASSTRTTLAPFTAGEWITFRIEVTGSRCDIYMNGLKVGSDLSTQLGETKATRIYLSMMNANEAWVDDIKVMVRD